MPLALRRSDGAVGAAAAFCNQALRAAHRGNTEVARTALANAQRVATGGLARADLRECVANLERVLGASPTPAGRATGHQPAR